MAITPQLQSVQTSSSLGASNSCTINVSANVVELILLSIGRRAIASGSTVASSPSLAWTAVLGSNTSSAAGSSNTTWAIASATAVYAVTVTTVAGTNSINQTQGV